MMESIADRGIFSKDRGHVKTQIQQSGVPQELSEAVTEAEEVITAALRESGAKTMEVEIRVRSSSDDMTHFEEAASPLLLTQRISEKVQSMLMGEIADLQERLSKMIKLVRDQKSSLDNLVGHVKELKRRIADLELRVKTRDTTIDNLEDRNQRLSRELCRQRDFASRIHDILGRSRAVRKGDLLEALELIE